MLFTGAVDIVKALLVKVALVDGDVFSLWILDTLDTTRRNDMTGFYQLDSRKVNDTTQDAVVVRLLTDVKKHF